MDMIVNIGEIFLMLIVFIEFFNKTRNKSKYNSITNDDDENDVFHKKTCLKNDNVDILRTNNSVNSSVIFCLKPNISTFLSKCHI